MNEQEELRRIMNEAVEIIIREGREELIEQGHNASGRLIASFEGQVQEVANQFFAEISVNDYAIYLDTGVPAKSIPYSRGSGAKTSKFIQGLFEWSQYVKPGLPDSERRAFVFSVANSMKKQGSPTSGAYAFSRNGRRKGWTDETIRAAEESIARMIEDGKFVEIAIERAFRESGAQVI